MVSTLGQRELAAYVAAQVSHFFPDSTVSGAALESAVAAASERMAYLLSKICPNYFPHRGLNHLNTDQFAMFLYLVANSIHRAGGDRDLATKVYALNKALHALDAFFEIELPEIFLFSHAVGTVLGRAKYANYFLVYQHCTVGSNLDGCYPVFGEGVALFGASAVIGDCAVGANAWLSYGTVAIDQAIPPASVVFGRSPALIIKATTRDVVKERFLF